MQGTIELEVSLEEHERLDTYLANELHAVSRSKVKAWCKEGRVQVQGQVRKASYLVSEGDHIVIDAPEERSPDYIKPENIPLNIVYEDDAIVVLDKAVGMVVHPGAGVYSGTLVNALAYHFEHLAQRGGVLRPGIVHRLDKGTSGLILVAKTDAAHHSLSDQWQMGTVTKVYQTLVWGIPDPAEGDIETQIGRHPKFRQLMAAEVENGRHAHSRYKVKQAYREAALVNVHILTGRTHQIRVHMAHIGHPVVGDAMYGKGRHKNLAQTFPDMPDHPMLHAAMLRFHHPTSGEIKTFKLDPPDDFKQCMDNLSRWPY